MEGSCSTGQSPQWAIVPMEEEEEEEEEEKKKEEEEEKEVFRSGYFPKHCFCTFSFRECVTSNTLCRECHSKYFG